MLKHRMFVITLFLGLLLAAAVPAYAINIAVFGVNSIFPWLNTQAGFVATAVTDAQIATPGFLNAFDVFLYTRDDASFGVGLSPGAAANVRGFVTGNVVLFMSDLADKIGPEAVDGEDPNANTAMGNAVNFAASGGKGYIGEFTGGCVALETNTSGGGDGLALGLLPGTCSFLGSEETGPFDILQNAHPVAAGLPDPWNSPGGMDFLAGASGVLPGQIVAQGLEPALRPTIIAGSRGAQVPEPSAVLLMASALAGLAAMRRLRVGAPSRLGSVL